MHAMPSVTPLSRTASMTSSVMSRTASPPAVRSSVSRWKTFTAPSTLLGPSCHDRPIVRVGAAYVTREPSVAGPVVVLVGGGHPVLRRGRLALRVRGRPTGGIARADADLAFHALLAVAVDRAVHLVGAARREGELDGL